MTQIIAVFIALGFMSLRSNAAETWDFLEIDFSISRTIAVKGISAFDNGRSVAFSVLDGYLPNTADLGYKSQVGSRVRSAVHRCGSKSVDVRHVWLLNEKKELFLDDDLDPPKQVPLETDDAIRRAALYACGDKSQKVGEVKHPTPADAFTLVCKDSKSEHEETYSISESRGLVNGFKAEITSSKITAVMVGFILEIDRYSGGFTVTQKEDNFRLFKGKCAKQEKRQF